MKYDFIAESGKTITQDTVHVVTFQLNTRNGLWRAVCSCGWFDVGSEDEVKTRAAGHDIEWTTVS